MRPFAEILRELVDASPMSGQEIANRADVSRAMLTKLMNGSRLNPGREVIAKLARTLGVKPQVFFE